IACRLEANARVFPQEWVSPRQPQINYPLSNCLNLPNNSPYRHGQASHTISITPGVPLWRADTCYDFAGLIKPSIKPVLQDTIFHTYWSTNITGFGDKQLDTLRSFVATQNPNSTKLFVWVPSTDTKALVFSAQWKMAQELAPKRIEYRTIDHKALTQNTPLADYVDDWRNHVYNTHTNQDMLLRLLVLSQYGGLWFDMDTLLVRDMGPLLEYEWISQGDCKTSMEGNPFDGGLLHFKKQSPFVCEMLEVAVDQFNIIKQTNTRFPVDNSQAKLLKLTANTPETFGAQLYYGVYRNILHHHIKPWSSLPWCFTDGTMCNSANALPKLTSESKVD
ncbi:hypothetical protein J3Q64DRAFT_1611254, partial [Phycomyces blakesleeanus]